WLSIRSCATPDYQSGPATRKRGCPVGRPLTLRESAGCWAMRLGYTARFLSFRRSRSLSPPQMPKRSSFASAYSRHSPRTSQDKQTFFASRVGPPFSGKNASGSVCAHSARSCQLSAPPSSVPLSSYMWLCLLDRHDGKPRNPYDFAGRNGFGLRRMHLPPAATGCPLGCGRTHSRKTPPDQQKTANDIGEITCLSIPESQAVS